ncbi:MAG TPA: RNA polymerase sigma factor, partial [Candidatus Saccharimonadales bacterium]|nr:RNA polymerase sigma factor [Candidatus Saccharimonadales bacterium]
MAGEDRGMGGDEFAEAVAEHRLALFRTLLAVSGDRDLAEDLCQDAIERAIQRRAQYRSEAPLGAWLHRIALNRWRDHLRWRRVRRLVGVDRGAGETSGSGRDWAVGRGAVEESIDLRAALLRIPARERAAIVLRYYHGYDYAAIGEALGVTQGSAGSILSRARRHLEVELNGTEPAEF